MKKTSILILLLIATLPGCLRGSGDSSTPPRPIAFDMFDVDGTYELTLGPGTLSIAANGYASGMFTLRDMLGQTSSYGVVEYHSSANLLLLYGSNGYSLSDYPSWRWNEDSRQWQAIIGQAGGRSWRRSY